MNNKPAERAYEYSKYNVAPLCKESRQKIIKNTGKVIKGIAFVTMFNEVSSVGERIMEINVPQRQGHVGHNAFRSVGHSGHLDANTRGGVNREGRNGRGREYLDPNPGCWRPDTT